MEATKYEQPFLVDLAGISDLIAAEGKYHNQCYQKFLRKTSKTRERTETADLAMECLIDELTTSASKSHVFQLSEVRQRYCNFAENTQIAIRPSCISRQRTFTEILED